MSASCPRCWPGFGLRDPQQPVVVPDYQVPTLRAQCIAHRSIIGSWRQIQQVCDHFLKTFDAFSIVSSHGDEASPAVLQRDDTVA